MHRRIPGLLFLAGVIFPAMAGQGIESISTLKDGARATRQANDLRAVTVYRMGIARQFHEEFGTPRQQFDLVIFLDGREKRRLAVEAGVDEFRQSWRRPKWHVVTQNLNTGRAAP